MYIVAIAWMFVVVCMAVVEAVTSSIVGGIGTLLLYGVLPLALVLWLLGAPQRSRNRARDERAERLARLPGPSADEAPPDQ